MADLKEKSTDNNQKQQHATVVHGNSLTFDDKVIKKIAGLAAGEVPGILALSGSFITGITDKIRNSGDPTRGITVEVGKKQVAIDMKVIAEYGRNIPTVFDSIVKQVSNVILEMTGLEVVEVNVHVDDVLSKEDFDLQSKKLRTEAKNEISRVE